MANVLVIDDEESIRKMIRTRLNREGHDVVSFADAAPALETVDFDSIDLIIADFVMPMSGEEAIRSLRSRGITVPIIVLSGCLERGDVKQLTSIGATRVLAKPFRLMGLLSTMEQLLPN